MFELFAFPFVLFVFSIEHLNEVYYFRTDSIKVSAIQRQQPWHRWWKGASKMGVPGGLQIGIWKMAAVFVIYFYDIQQQHWSSSICRISLFMNFMNRTLHEWT